MDKDRVKRKKEALKKKEDEEREEVIEFLRNHPDEAFTRWEIMNRTGVDNVRTYTSPWKPGKIETFREGTETYYYWEEEIPGPYVFFIVVACVLIGLILAA